MGGGLAKVSRPLGRVCISLSSKSVIKIQLWLGQRGSCPSHCVAVGGTVWAGPARQVLPGGGSGQEAKDETFRLCGGWGPRLGSQNSHQGVTQQ